MHILKLHNSLETQFFLWQVTKSMDSKPSKQKSKSRRRSSPPPQQTSQENTPQNAVGNIPSSWYSEVVELRKRADEYKRRGQGTHFSRQHLAQLMARQAEMWDTASMSSVLSALSLEPPQVIRYRHFIELYAFHFQIALTQSKVFTCEFDILFYL